jgi:hypothetical protein
MKTIKKPPLPEITKGSIFYLVYDDKRDGSSKEVTVTSVGREWIGVDDYRTKRFRKGTMISDCGRAKLYGSREVYEAELARKTNWDKLRQTVSATWKVPEDLSGEAIQKALDLLKPGAPKSGETVFAVRINGGDEQSLACRTDVYQEAAVAAVAMLDYVKIEGADYEVVDLWIADLLPDYGPYRYLVVKTAGGGLTVRPA